MRTSLLMLLATLLSLSLFVSAETKYVIDPSHTSVDFTISHLVISSVTGKFKEVSGTLTSSKDDFTDAKINILIPAKSINTENEKRDEHLRSADFFDVAKYPDVEFKSVSVQKTSDNNYIITGDLKMHGVTKPVELKTVLKGSVKSPWGQTVVAFKASTVIARKEWGIIWNKVMEAGGVLVGEDVEVILNVELIKQ